VQRGWAGMRTILWVWGRDGDELLSPCRSLAFEQRSTQCKKFCVCVFITVFGGTVYIQDLPAASPVLCVGSGDMFGDCVFVLEFLTCFKPLLNFEFPSDLTVGM